MPGVGGSVESIAIKARLFPVASDADATRKLGGFENEVASNGDSTARIIKTRVPWMLSGVVVEIDDTRADQEFLQEIADAKEYVDVAITFASGFVYQGSGIITGELQFSSQNSTASVSLSGPGSMSQQ